MTLARETDLPGDRAHGDSTAGERRRVLAAGIVLALTVIAPSFGAAVPGTGVDAAVLVEGLEWEFDVTDGQEIVPDDEERWPQTTEFRFTTIEPIRRGSGGEIHGRIELWAHRYGHPSSALEAFETLLESADPDTGLTYAWDQIYSAGVHLYRLHAPCTLSEESFDLVVARLKEELRRSAGEELTAASCRCGGGCRRRPEGEVSR